MYGCSIASRGVGRRHLWQLESLTDTLLCMNWNMVLLVLVQVDHW